MNVEIVNTGSELLLGNVVNTHLAYFGKALFALGLRIQRQTTVPDGLAIREVLLEIFPRADVVIVTGGLGPTTDDITREITAELLGLKLHESPAVRASIQARLDRRGIPFQERMARQCMVPEGAIVLTNDHGTAPGLYLAARDTESGRVPHLFFLPGPPRELMPMFANYATPILQEISRDEVKAGECRIYHIVGMGESIVEAEVGLELTRRGDLEVGYCARPNEVDLRLIGPREVLDEVEPEILAKLGKNFVSRGEPLEEVVVRELTTLGLTIATAESCTGGLVAHRLTNVSGSSAVFPTGLVTYANETKARLLGVSPTLLAEHGAVSEPVARAMAEGVLRDSGTDFGLSLTGIAGPSGGTPEKPVGTVFIALAQKEHETICVKKTFPSDRETFKRLASQSALDLVRLRLRELQAA